MDERSAAHWLTLARAPMGEARRQEIAARLPSPASSAPESPVSAYPALRVSDLMIDALVNHELEALVERDLERLQSGEFSLVTLACAGYPLRLKQVDRPPVLLFVRGCVDALARPQISIVGSRNATHQGLETAQDFAGRLSECGFAITSGLARGIDGAAHVGCLAVQGCTIAVAATGPDRVYPAAHRALAGKIIDAGGAVITEFPPGVPPKAQNFPRRNRIISGLSLGTLVIEAAVRSGSLITARFAVEHGREVFAIPGSIHNPAARGCHRLIRQGAKLVEQVDDILEEFEWLAVPAQTVQNSAPDAGPAVQPGGLAARIHDAIDYGPTDFDTVIRRTGLGAMEVSTALVELELRGLVCKSAGFFSRRGDGR